MMKLQDNWDDDRIRAVFEEYGVCPEINPWIEKDHPRGIVPHRLQHLEGAAHTVPEAVKQIFAESHHRVLTHFFEMVDCLHKNRSTDLGLPFAIFPEIPFTCLGTSKSGHDGHGVSKKDSQKLIDNLSSLIPKLRSATFEQKGSIFQLFGVLPGGIGRDGISDMLTNLILVDLLEYNDKIMKECQQELSSGFTDVKEWKIEDLFSTIKKDQNRHFERYKFKKYGLLEQRYHDDDLQKSWLLPSKSDESPLILVPNFLLEPLPKPRSQEQLFWLFQSNRALRNRVEASLTKPCLVDGEASERIFHRLDLLAYTNLLNNTPTIADHTFLVPFQIDFDLLTPILHALEAQGVISSLTFVRHRSMCRFNVGKRLCVLTATQFAPRNPTKSPPDFTPEQVQQLTQETALARSTELGSPEMRLKESLPLIDPVLRTNAEIRACFLEPPYPKKYSQVTWDCGAMGQFNSLTVIAIAEKKPIRKNSFPFTVFVSDKCTVYRNKESASLVQHSKDEDLCNKTNAFIEWMTRSIPDFNVHYDTYFASDSSYQLVLSTNEPAQQLLRESKFPQSSSSSTSTPHPIYASSESPRIGGLLRDLQKNSKFGPKSKLTFVTPAVIPEYIKSATTRAHALSAALAFALFSLKESQEARIPPGLSINNARFGDGSNNTIGVSVHVHPPSLSPPRPAKRSAHPIEIESDPKRSSACLRQDTGDDLGASLSNT